LETVVAFTLPPNSLDRELVFEFFWKFSAFECALKRKQFLRADRYGNAMADWGQFGREIQGEFTKVSVPGFAKAAEQLRELSPHRQVVRNKRMGWEPIRQNGQSDAEHTLDLMRTVRNNLFHGGKYPDGPIEEISRNRDILQAALTILEGCRELHAGVKRLLEDEAA
jgi:hypothetical protein